MRGDGDEARFRRLIRDQDGVFAVAQANAAGYSRAMIAARVRRGEWERVGPRVLRSADHADTARSRIRAAMLSLGPGATLIGRSAAFWWRMTDVAPAEVEVAVCPPAQPRPRSGVRVVRRAIAPEERMMVDGVAVTKKATTVLTAVAVLGLVAGARLMDRVLQQGVVGLDALRAVHLRTSGRHGAAVGTELLRLAGGGARSEAERVAHRVLAGAGLVGWEADVEVRLRGYGIAVLDLAFREHRVLVEIDGWAWHRDLRAFLRDAARQNALVLEGWVVIRTNWFELTERPEVFRANVLAALGEVRRSKI